MVLIILIFQFIEKELMPTVVAISSMKIKTMTTVMINQAINETLFELEAQTNDLVSYYYDDDGNMISLGINSVLVNLIGSSIVEKLSEDLNDYDVEKLEIPLGKLLGKSVFSNFGPPIKISILPTGTVSTAYKSELVNAGINQIKHRIWLRVEMTMQVVVPFRQATVKSCQDLTLVDRVIQGEVPDQYIVVPQDEIWNVVN